MKKTRDEGRKNLKEGKRLDLYITANSPGEIAGRVVPLVRAIRARVRRCRITLVILPCQYASGSELSMAEGVEVDRCVGIRRLGSLIQSESRGQDNEKCLVLHMGGDVLFAIYVSRRLKAPLWVYASRPRWGRFVDRFFVPDQRAIDRFVALDYPKERYERIGEISLDSVVLNATEEESRERLGLSPEEPVLTFLTGSRPIEYCEGVPYFARIASGILDSFPGHRVFFPLAPTVREDLLEDAVKNASLEWKGKSRIHALNLGKGRWASVVRGMTLEVLNCSTLAIAVPGTNNLQAAALYVPYIMVLPLDGADEYPLDGFMGLLPLSFPGVRMLKKAYIMRLNEKTEFVSLPNKMAGKELAPEIRGIFEPEEVVKSAVSLLGSPKKLKEMSRAFFELTHERGASARLAARVVDWTSENGRG